MGASIFWGCGEVLPADDSEMGLSPGNHEFSVTSDGLARRYLVHLPPRGVQGRTAATVVAFHGGGGTPEGLQATAGLDAVADREGFVVVYPAGVGRVSAALTWNAGPGCCGYARDESVDDVAFFQRVVDDLAERHPTDRDAVWVTGHSNGSMMAYRVAAATPERVSGVVGVAGAMQLPTITPTEPVPVLHIHSEDDPRAFYFGGARASTGTVHPQVQLMLDAWARANGCLAQARETEHREGEGLDEGQEADLLLWSCAGAPLEHWRLRASGHAWPGNRVSAAWARVVGPSTEVVLAAEEVWRFMKKTGA